jgi:hypothetical protein
MLYKRIGHWSWALSADERKTAALVERRQRDQSRITTRLQRKHEAMLEKERKLGAREKQLERQGVASIGRSRLRFRPPLSAWNAGDMPAG